MCIEAWRRWLLVLFALFLVATSGAINAAPRTHIDYRLAELAMGGDSPPQQGWSVVPIPDEDAITPARKIELRETGQVYNNIWVRISFDRAEFGGGPLALATAKTLSRMNVRLNGTMLQKDIIRGNDQTFTWKHPELIFLPPGMLQPGRNEILFQLRTSSPLVNGIGFIRVGQQGAVRSFYLWHFVTEFLGPLVINGTLLVLTAAIFLLWLKRRREIEFGWLALVGVVWVVRNLHYFIAVVPYANGLYWALTVDSLFAVVVTTYAFATEFFKVPGRKTIIRRMAIVLGLAAIGRYVCIALGLTDVYVIAVLIPAVWFVVPTLYRAWRKEPRFDNFLMLAAVVVTNLMSMTDFAMIKLAIPGVGFYLQPYAGLLIFLAFSYAVGRRIIAALDTVENMNQLLQQRVNEAQELLLESEAARRALEVQTAVNTERERLMMEIHDGIGSNLITALSVAEKKRASAETIDVLRQSITDLKITVDSLEQIDGHVTSLLANLRQRLEPDLNKAGFRFDWRVQDAPVLIWLDAVAALHVLRIVQAAIGNIVAHSGSDQIIVECGPLAHGGADGVLIVIRDEGRGFDPAALTQGKGIANMESRAKSIHGTLVCESCVGTGTAVSLWLPVLSIRDPRVQL